jgi:hypothetical protein
MGDRVRWEIELNIIRDVGFPAAAAFFLFYWSVGTSFKAQAPGLNHCNQGVLAFSQ